MKLIYKKISILLSLLIIIFNISACDSITSTNSNNSHINNETTGESQLISTASTINNNNSFIPYTEYNELGRVPIMMYHGIENIKSSDTGFVGGNVDKDGYFRTAEAFREDLEFFYNSGYRMIRLIDYVNGIIDCPAGYSPIILTFDDGYESNIRINNINSDGSLDIDKNSAIGILEEMKQKYPDFNVTATFFLTGKLFRNNNSKTSMHWLIENGYDIGNHTYNHIDLTTNDVNFAITDVALQYENLDEILGPNKAVNIVALPLGAPYSFEDKRASSLIDFYIGEKHYHTASLMRVGYAPERSPYDKNINIHYIMRVRAYDNNGEEYDIESTFRLLNKTRYISDGNVDTITIKEQDSHMLGNTYNLSIISY